MLSIFIDCPAPLRDRHSFPTRRSSDLAPRNPRVIRPLCSQYLKNSGTETVVSAVAHSSPCLIDKGSTEGRAPMVPDSDRKSTRLNSSHGYISYAVCSLKKYIEE